MPTVVIFVYREEYYLARQEPRARQPKVMRNGWLDMEAVHGEAEVIIGKQRHGPTGIVELQFDASLMRFGDLSRPAVGGEDQPVSTWHACRQVEEPRPVFGATRVL